MIAGARAVETTAGGRPVLVVRPAASPGQCSIDMLCTLARARSRAAAACFLAPPGDAGPLAAAVAGADVPVIRPGGLQLAWFESRWRASTAADRALSSWRAPAASGLQELYRELRRHAGDERLPVALRRRLREAGHRSYERSLALRSPQAAYPRRLLRDSSAITWQPRLLDDARAELRAAGVPTDTPVVAFEARTRPAVAREAIRLLTTEGYTVVRIGDTGTGRLRYPGLVDLSATRPWSPSADLSILAHARFAVVGSLELQQLAYLTNTPTLTIDAVDPFTLYPIRPHGVLLLATAVDLDSGRELPVDEWLTEGYLRNRRNWGYRGVPAGDLLAGVREMQDGLARGWQDSDAQRRFRSRINEIGRALAPGMPFVAGWGPDGGFIGEGRLARVQAVRTS